MRNKINVLSLFGGMECGRIAIENLGLEVGGYFSAEVDEYAMKIAKHNFPDIVHIGDVKDISFSGSVLSWKGYNAPYIFTGIDLLIGGPPCQDLSIAGKRAGLDGERSGLFYEYVRILNETKPKYFLMENVASMPKEAKQTITDALFGIEPIMINSALVSAQNRKRLYWVGKRNDNGTYSRVEIPQPEDRGIMLRDILEDIPFDYDQNYQKKAGSSIKWRPLPEKYVSLVRERQKSFGITATYAGACPRGDFEKSNRTIIVQIPRGKNNGNIHDEKSPTVGASAFQDNNLVIGQFRRSDIRIHADQENSPTLTANMGTGGNNVPIVMGMAHRNRGNGKEPEMNGMQKANSLTTVRSDSEVLAIPEYLWRKLTARECARLQTIPESFEFTVSDSRAYKAIGNGWTVDIIAHILSYLPL